MRKQLIFCVGIICQILSSPTAFAQDSPILWSDDFNDNDPYAQRDVGWIRFGDRIGLEGAVVEQEDGWLHLKMGSLRGYLSGVIAGTNGVPTLDYYLGELTPESIDNIMKNNYSSPNQEISFDFYYPLYAPLSQFGLCTRLDIAGLENYYPDFSDAYIFLFEPIAGRLSIAYSTGGIDLVNPNGYQYLRSTEYPLLRGEIYSVKVVADGDQLKFKIWERDLEREPEEWMMEVTDPEPLLQGTFTVVGLLGNNSKTAGELYLDNFTLRGLPQTQRPPNNFIRTISPSPLSNTADRTANIRVTFAAKILPATLNDSTVAIFGDQTGKIPGDIYYSAADSSMVFTPTSPFKVGEKIFISLTADIRTVSGTHPTQGMAWSFTTRGNSAGGPLRPNQMFFPNDAITGFSIGDLDHDQVNEMILARDSDPSSDLLIYTLKKDETRLVQQLPAFGGYSLLRNSGLGDLDKDTNLDLLFAGGQDNLTDGFWRLFIGSGAGAFTLSDPMYQTSGLCSELHACDMEGDGDQDVISLNGNSFAEYPCEIQLFENEASSFTANERFHISTGMNRIDRIIPADIDHDFLTDLIVVEKTMDWPSLSFPSGMRIVLYRNTGTSFQKLRTTTELPGYSQVQAAAADFNMDGYIDVAIANDTGLNIVYLGQFYHMSVENIHPGSSIPSALATADLDGNGSPDLVAAYPDTLVIFYTSDRGDFLPPEIFPGMQAGNEMQIADLDGDDDLDIACLQKNQKGLILWLNDEEPDLQIKPDSILIEVKEDQSAEARLTLSNRGKEPISIDPSVTLGIPGGTQDDVLGYTWSDSKGLGNTKFDWIDITQTGKRIDLYADDQIVEMEIGFTFPFFGISYQKMNICSNGFLSFNSTYPSYSNRPIPSEYEPNAMIAPYWDDLFHPQVFCRYDHHRTIIEYYQSDGRTFEIVLYPSGRIVLQYLDDFSGFNDATIGIENGSGTKGIEIAFDSDYLVNNMAIEIIPIGAVLSVQPENAMLNPGDSTQFKIVADATDLPSGLYTGTVDIQSNAVLSPLLSVPIQVRVIGMPDLVLGAASLNFNKTYIGFADTLAVKIWNDGSARGDLQLPQVENPAFTAWLQSTSLSPGDTTRLFVCFSPVNDGIELDTVIVLSNDENAPALKLLIQATGRIAPLISFDPSQLFSQLSEGVTEIQTLDISNRTDGSLHFRLDFRAEPPSNSLLSVADILKANEATARKATISTPTDTKHTLSGMALDGKKYDPEAWQSILKTHAQDYSYQPYPIKIAVIRGSGTTREGFIKTWDHLNLNWRKYGRNEIIIDYATLNKLNISAADLQASQADVLVISSFPDQADPLSAEECNSIAAYVQAGHGLYASGAILVGDSASNPRLTPLSSLFGIRPDLNFRWDYLSYGESMELLSPDDLLAGGINSPLVPDYSASTVPVTASFWEQALTDGELIALSPSKRCALLAKDNRIFSSTLLEYTYWDVNIQNAQFLFNMFSRCASRALSWCYSPVWADSIMGQASKSIPIHFSSFGLDQDTYKGSLLISSDDPLNRKAILNFTLSVIDTTPPAAIKDFQLVNAGSGYAMLKWTSQGDNDTLEIADHYDIRYAEAPLTDDNWPQAVAIMDTLIPKPSWPGHTEDLILDGLLPETHYYFGIRTVDEANNIASLSNVLTVQTAKSLPGIIHLPLDERKGQQAFNTQNSKYFHGTLNNFASLEQQDVDPASGWTRFGKKDGGLAFDGQNDLVRIADYSYSPISVNSGLALRLSFSLPDSTSRQSDQFPVQTLIEKYEWFGGGYALQLDREHGKLLFILRWTNEDFRVFESRPTNWRAGKWYTAGVNYSFTGKAGVITLFINDSLSARYTDSRVLVTNTADIIIGASLVYGDHFAGTLDEITIHNAAIPGSGGGEFKFTSPAQGDQVTVGTELLISWNTNQVNDPISILLSRNRGISWETLAANIANSGDYNWLVSPPVSSDCLLKLTDSAGNLIALSDSLFSIRYLTGIEDRNGAIPKDYAFFQNYPNPFNHVSTLTYHLPTTNRVRIEVFDVAGHVVKTICRREQKAGMYQEQWDGTDGNGKAVASGLYFCKMVAGDYEKIIRMSLVK